jgi:hypothetical protein
MSQSVFSARSLVALAAVVASAGVSLAQPDVVLSGINDMTNYGQVGNIYAYAIGSNTCNNGNQNFNWTNNGTPGIAMNMYRLTNGRLTQVGQSWVKTACCAAAGSGCVGTCNGQGGTVLGAGCLDVYSSGWNGGQGRLATKNGINPYTRAFGNATGGGATNAINRRLQVPATEIVPNSTANLYFVEGVYVCTQETLATSMNNASYRRITMATAAGTPTLQGTIAQGIPAIRAWRDHGLGVGVVDNRVAVNTLDIPAEGRFWTAYKVTDLGNGQWLYDYAIFNLNSHVAANSLTIPVPAGVNVSGMGFKDVNYHSGDTTDNTDWTMTTTGGTMSWTGPNFATSPNGNSLRWGTMYNFWFTADQPPVAAQANMGLFRPHSVQSINFTVQGPDAPSSPCDYDFNRDENVDLSDAQNMAQVFVGTLAPGAGWLDGDLNGDENADLTDAQILAQFVVTGTCGL